MGISLHALVIDDEPQVSGLVAHVLRSAGWMVTEVRTADEAFAKLDDQPWDLVFCDVVLGGADGYDVLRYFSEKQPEARFVLMTGHGSAAGALDATSIGAYDYLVKPFKIDEILGISSAVREQHQQRVREDRRSPAKIDAGGYQSELPLIGNSPKFVECLKMVGRVASTNLPVLIAGESGTGKEVVARAIHQRSHRSDGPFVTINCGAVPTDLIESELFGHAKGSFTGADRERVGLWEAASGGTLLLDEITETSPLFQVKLLRALQEGEIRRVGSNRTVSVDVRVLAATNCDIEAEVRQNRFRQDLMYRLNAVTIELPPLRERIEDVPVLAEHFAKHVRIQDRGRVTFSAAAIEKLKSYKWPGNVRELENAILHAVSLCDGVIYPEHLPARVREFDPMRSTSGAKDLADPIPSFGSGKLPSLAEVAEQYAARVLAETGGNKQAAARILDVDRKTLARILKRQTTADEELGVEEKTKQLS